MKTQQASPLDVQALRRDFPILSRLVHGDRPLVYFDNAATTQRPRQVIQSLVEVYEKHYANVHRGIHWLSEQSTDLYSEAREKVRAFINARHAEEVIFTRGTTESINLVARSWGDRNVGPGDEILLTEMEHHSNIVPWQQLAARTGAALRYVPVRDDGLLDLEAFQQLLSDRTKIVAVTAASNVLGTYTPVAQIVLQAHAAGAKVLVDAAQSVPHTTTDVQTLDADFLAFSGHKLMGPTGIGVLYGRQELLAAMPPFLGGGSMIRRVTLDGFEPADLPARFEAGTPPIVEAIGLGVAIDYLRGIGLEKVHQHERLLTAAVQDAIGSLSGVRIYGPPLEQKAGIVSFALSGIHAHDVAQILDQQGIAVRAGHHCAMPLHNRLGIAATTRVSFYLYNTLAEIEHLAPALEKVKRTLRRA
ncbi:MAG: aminotransferase class V-fold PLP-dependent enzyme [Pirellulales bacterium]